MARKTRKRPDAQGRPAGGPPSPRVAYQATDDALVPGGDIAMVLGKDADGLHILRRRSEAGPIEAGLLRPMREGKPISGEVVSLTPRQDLPMIFDVKTEFSLASASAGDPPPPPEDEAQRSSVDGPAQVATDAYRKGWDAVWGSRRRDRTLN